MPMQAISVYQVDASLQLEARIADESHERAAGYQWICADEAESSAVLFVFESEVNSSFHMRNVFVPLEIYFFDASGQAVDQMVMRPEPPSFKGARRYYHPKGAFKYALEIAQGSEYDLSTKLVPLQLLIETIH